VGTERLIKMSCEVCYGYSSRNCPCCQIDPDEAIIEAMMEADETKFDIIFEDRIVAVCESHILTRFISQENLKIDSEDADQVIVSGNGFEFWAIRQHSDSMDVWERSQSCDEPIGMHLFADKAIG